jgi:hypothetical protein
MSEVSIHAPYHKNVILFYSRIEITQTRNFFAYLTNEMQRNTASSYGVLFFVVKHISITLTLQTRHQSHTIENKIELLSINHFLHLLKI